MMEFKNVCKKVKNLNIQNINFNLPVPGKVYFLIGSEGSGTKQILDMISGLINPDSGSINFNNQNIKLFKNKEKTGYFLKNFNLTVPLKISEFVSLLKNSCSGSNLVTTFLQQEFPEFLQPVYLNQKIKNLEKAEMQKLNFIQSVYCEPLINLFDNPFEVVSSDLLIIIQKFLKNISKKDKYAIVTSVKLHEEYHNLADKYIFFKNGKIIREYSPEEIKGSFYYCDQIDIISKLSDELTKINLNFQIFNQLDNLDILVFEKPGNKYFEKMEFTKFIKPLNNYSLLNQFIFNLEVDYL
jgi:ABC-type multidrug transport system ATPase subunit